MDNYQKRCPIDGGTCGQGGTCYVCENESLESQLAAAEARIAELMQALGPLADIVGAWGEHDSDMDEKLVLMQCADARRASALLKEKE